MRQYLDLCEHILAHGTKKEDRTGTGTLSVFGYQMRFDLAEGFPLMTTKDMAEPNEKTGVSRLDGIIHELLWFLNGDTNIATLVEDGVNIWNRDAYRAYRNKDGTETYRDFVGFMKTSTHFQKMHGDLGRVYGSQWRSWQGAEGSVIDQISNLVEDLKKNPNSRRHIVTAWNPAEVDDVVLPPCHVLFQFYVADGKLSCQLYQRSGDVFLGVPFNIASYALLTMMVADQVGLGYGEFIHTIGDAHIYLNHVSQVEEQVKREPYYPPIMDIKHDEAVDIFSYKREHFRLFWYRSHPELKGAVSVGN